MRILMQNRPDAYERPGGDTIQMDRTIRALHEAGHDVDLSLEAEPDLGGETSTASTADTAHSGSATYDLVYLFNLTTLAWTVRQARNALRHGVPYVLSSVYWDLESAVPWRAYEFPRNIARALLPRFAIRVIKALRGGGGKGEQALQREILAGARCVFPNSTAERDHLLTRFSTIPRDKFVVVLNGVDPPAMQAKGSGGYFLCAGAIGPRKNQLNLVRAFHRLDRERLLIVGNAAHGCERYMKAVVRAAPPNVEFRSAVPHAEMTALLADAKALVQPSYIETPGLSAMEAAAMGVPIVVSNVPPVYAYFGDLGFYCDPSDSDSIVDACRAAGMAGHRDGRAFADQYDWRRVLAPMVKRVEASVRPG